MRYAHVIADKDSEEVICVTCDANLARGLLKCTAHPLLAITVPLVESDIRGSEVLNLFENESEEGM